MDGLSRKARTRLAWHISVALIVAAAGMWTLASPVYAVDANELPVVDTSLAIRGDAVVSASVVADGRSTLNINQTSDRAVINWRSFNIGANATVNFNHTKDGRQNTAAMTLNRVTGSNLSEIYGQINAIGSVLLINPHGVLFARGSEVNAAGIVVSTAEINIDDFYKKGELKFAQDENSLNSAVTVNGRLTAAINGDYLAADSVYARSLASSSLNIGKREIVTALAVVGNKIMLVADGDVAVGSSGELTATTCTNIATLASEGASGASATTDKMLAAEGAIILRADQNADDVNVTGSTAAKVILENTSPEQIQGLNVAAYFNGDIVKGVKASPASTVASGAKGGKFTKKNYKSAATYAAALKGKVAQTVTKYENVAGAYEYQASIVAPSSQIYATLINDVYQLQCIANTGYGDLSGAYALGRDIAAADTANWASGFNPIGTFTGSFSGSAGTGGYKIYDLTIKRSTESYVGLFGQVSGATITEATLVDPVINGKNYVGALAGSIAGSRLENITVRKRVAALDGAGTATDGANVLGAQYVAGIVGQLTGSTLINGENGAQIGGESYVGGLVGRLYSDDGEQSAVVNSRSRGYYSLAENVTQGYGRVYASSAKYIGGLIGYASSAGGGRNSLTDSWSNGQVLVDSSRDTSLTGVGGLVGYSGGTMTLARCYNTNEGASRGATIASESAAKSIYGQVSAPNATKVGGLVGYAGASVSLEQVYNAGNITGASRVGGLAGQLLGTISDAYNADTNTVLVAGGTLSYHDATITGTGDDVGALVGQQGSSAVLNNTYAIGTVNGVMVDTLAALDDMSSFSADKWVLGENTAPRLRVFMPAATSADAGDTSGGSYDIAANGARLVFADEHRRYESIVGATVATASRERAAISGRAMPRLDGGASPLLRIEGRGIRATKIADTLEAIAIVPYGYAIVQGLNNDSDEEKELS